MSTSFVEYRGKGFWSWDGYLEHVLTMLAEEVPEQGDSPWLGEAKRHWCEQASGAFRGMIDPLLDEFASTDDRRQTILRVMAGAAQHAGTTREAKETFALLAALLRGELETNASSPLDYMVTGKHPYDWRAEFGAGNK